MKDKQEFYIAATLFLAVLSIANVVYVHALLDKFHLNGSSFNLNGDNFTQVGMMQYENPADHNIVYFPIYTKGDK